MENSRKISGGLARAKSLSADDRSMIAKKGAATRWHPETLESDYPESPFAKYPGQIDLGGDPIEVYVLDTGVRVLSVRSFLRTIANREGGNLAEYIGIHGLKPFIDSDLLAAGTTEFNIPGSSKGRGLTTEQFELICRAYIKALYEGTLSTERQKEIAIKCALIVSGLTRAGLDALIDEATGYQYVRAEDAIQVKLRAFIADELRAWEKTFPDELWEEFGRLTNWQGSIRHRPKWWGKLVIELIYDTFEPEVADYLKNNKPPTGVRWHQQLSTTYGLRQLVSRCYEIIGVAKTCRTIGDLKEKVANLYGKEAVQMTFFIPNRK